MQKPVLIPEIQTPHNELVLSTDRQNGFGKKLFADVLHAVDSAYGPHWGHFFRIS